MANKTLWYVVLCNLSEAHSAMTIHCKEDVRGLRRWGYDTMFFCRADVIRPGLDDISEAVVVCKNGHFFFRAMFEIKMICRAIFAQRKPDFVMFRGTSLLCLGLVLHLLDIPFGVEIAGTPHFFLHKSCWGWKCYADAFFIKHASVIIALTQELADLAKSLNPNQAVISVAGVGVNADEYQPFVMEQRPRTNCLTLGFIGLIYDDGRVDMIIEAIAELKNRGIEAALIVVGDGPGRKSAELCAAKLGVNDSIQFNSSVLPSKLAELICDCDLTVALYSKIPLFELGGVNPAKVWTSLAMGKPVLMYYPGHINRYQNIPGVFNCPDTDPKTVADTIAKIWNKYNKKGLSEIGLSGREYVAENITWEKHTKIISETISLALK